MEVSVLNIWVLIYVLWSVGIVYGAFKYIQWYWYADKELSQEMSEISRRYSNNRKVANRQINVATLQHLKDSCARLVMLIIAVVSLIAYSHWISG